MPDDRRSHPGLVLLCEVEAGDWEAALPGGPQTPAREAILAAARHLRLPAALETEVSVTLADDETVRALNAEWRGKDRPTNILSFPTVQLAPGDRPGPLAGDLILAFETVLREAAEEEKPFDHHFRHLVVHGFLHLLGYDHVEEEEAEEMEAAEIAILATLGIPDPYGEAPDARPARTQPFQKA